MNRLIIRNGEELSAAIAKADNLMGCTDDSDEERELAALADAIDLYQESIDMMRRVGRKATSEPPNGVTDIDGSE